MAFKTKKEKQQAIVLGALLAVILGTLFWYFGDRFLPRAAGRPASLSAPQRLKLPKRGDDAAFYLRSDFAQLTRTPGTPVAPVELNGSGSPFDDVFAP